MNALNEWLYVAGISITIVLAGLALMVGIGLLTVPHRMRETMRAANQKYSLRRALKPVEIPRDADRLIYRHHRIVGALLAVASAFFLFVYLTESPQASYIEWFQRHFRSNAFSATLTGLAGFLAIVNLLAFILGVVLFVRPSALKPVERIANRWYSTRQATRALDREFETMDSAVMRHPRLTGGLIIVGAFYILLNLVQVASMLASR